MADFIVRGMQKNCDEMSYQIARLRYLRVQLDELVQQMSRDELFETSVNRLVKLEKDAETEQSGLFKLTQALFRIDSRYNRCEEGIVDYAEDVRRKKALRGMERFDVVLPPGFDVTIKLY